jgi:alpha-beta hydrolase superfamily lysophospholipase
MDELFEAQLRRAIGTAAYGGADVDECRATADRITAVDLDLWHREWMATGYRALERGEYLHASTYFRTAWLFLLDAPVDPRLAEAHRLEVESFRRGTESFDRQVVEIPYQDGLTLPGYVFRPADDGREHPTMILTTGYDGTAEELWFTSGAAAVARGYNVVLVDGPGQGTMLLERGTVLRPDWENVVTPVVDFVLGLPGVDPARIVLSGLSLGGYTAPRAATAEHRLAACVSDCGPYDVGETVRSRIPRVLRGPLLRWVLTAVMGKPTAGWALRRARLVHGATDPIHYLRIAADYTLRGREHLIECPTFVCSAEGDDLSARAEELYEALTCPKEYVRFTAAEGAGDHCEALARPLVNARVLTWLDEVLAPAPSASDGSALRGPAPRVTATA